MTEKKEKKYVSDNALLMAEWNWEKNTTFDSTRLALGSNKKVWWICSQRHEWTATPSNRSSGTGCPYCANRRVLKGYNDLQTLNAILASEWNYEKNKETTPDSVTPQSHQTVWWKCSEGHEWQAAIYSRHSGCGCPYCAGRIVITGQNDLQTINPNLAKEWNYRRNNGITPSEVMPNSGKKIWWTCHNGHEYQSTIANRSYGYGCPFCAGLKVLIGYNDLVTVNPILAQEWDYDKNGILIPEQFTANSNKKVWWKCQKGHEWQTTITNRHNGNGCPICSSERNTSFPEYALVYYLTKYGLEVIHSYNANGYELDVYIPSQNIGIEFDGYYWHKDKTIKDKEKNNNCKKDGIILYRIREGLPSLNDSSIDYITRKDHKDLSSIMSDIIREITNVIVDVNLDRDAIEIEILREHTEKERSIISLKPELAKEWNYEKNGELKPEHFTIGSNKKVWWKCSQGHEWQARVASRNRGSSCPYCSGRYAISGESDLKTINPSIAKEWHNERNGEMKPNHFTANSGKKVWWKCSDGHEWQATIANRNGGTGCPYCSNNKVLSGYNDLQTLNPILAAEWNYEKNGSLRPSDILPNSSKKAWWKCSQGHEWQATISSRNSGKGCPHCSGRSAIKGENDLLTTNPSLATEWNCEKNDGLTPADVLPNSNKKVWWKCSQGHEWQAIIANRNKRGDGCPECAKEKRKNKKE